MYFTLWKEVVGLMTFSLPHSSLSPLQLTIDIAHVVVEEPHVFWNKYFADLVTVLGNSHVDLCMLYQLHAIHNLGRCNRNMQGQGQHQWIPMDPIKFYQQRFWPYESRRNRFLQIQMGEGTDFLTYWEGVRVHLWWSPSVLLWKWSVRGWVHSSSWDLLSRIQSALCIITVLWTYKESFQQDEVGHWGAQAPSPTYSSAHAVWEL